MLKNNGNLGMRKFASFMVSRNIKYVCNSGDGSAPIVEDVPFPSDYTELIDQVSLITSHFLSIISVQEKKVFNIFSNPKEKQKKLLINGLLGSKLIC